MTQRCLTTQISTNNFSVTLLMLAMEEVAVRTGFKPRGRGRRRKPLIRKLARAVRSGDYASPLLIQNIKRISPRYEVQEKLQNFMVPVPVAGGWHDEQIDELFGSLLGKGYEDGVIHDQESQPTHTPVDLAGFRVFG